MRAVIIANGSVGSKSFFDGIIKKDDYIICADGGYAHAQNMGVMPDIVLGDFDSYEISKIVCDNVVVYPAKKDHTDTEIAILHAIDKGYTEIVLLGCIGTRLDHTLASIFLLRKIYESGAKGVIVDENNSVYYTENHIELHGKKGDLLSIIPVTSECSGVCTKGLYYELTDAKMEFSSSFGISNVFVEDTAVVTITSGSALVITAKD